MLLNVAVGGTWPGNPNQTTVFPQEMVVDYVRVYQQVPAHRMRSHDGELPSSISCSRIIRTPSIRYDASSSLPHGADVSLDVFDVMGRHVRNLAGGIHHAGYHAVKFDASALPSGFYTYRLRAGIATAPFGRCCSSSDHGEDPCIPQTSPSSATLTPWEQSQVTTMRHLIRSFIVAVLASYPGARCFRANHNGSCG
jgi:hypothetical protein